MPAGHGRLKSSILFVLLALWVVACSRPVLEGAQVTRVPPGFGFDANATVARLVFPDREKMDQRGYFALGPDDVHSDITITEYAGKTTYEQAAAARSAAASKYGYAEYGPLETLLLDGRTAWGWTVTQRARGEVTGLEVVAVVCYPKAGHTFSVEFYSCDSRYMDAELMKKTLAGFTVKNGKNLSPARIGLAGLLVVAVWIAFVRFRPGR